MAYRLKQDETARKAIRRIVANQAERALEDLQREEGAAHEARKRIKRIRAALRLARPGMKKADFARENAAWREAGWLLSPLRDHEARLETVARLRDQVEEPLAMAALSSLRENLAAHAPLDAQSTLDRAARMIREAGERALDLRIDGEPRDVFAASMRRAYRRGGERAAAAFESGAAEDFHDWRKSVKTLALQLRIVEPAAPAQTGATRERLEELGEMLGEDHDLARLRALLAQRADLVETADQREALMLRLAERSLMLRARARPVYQALYAEKPKAFGRRMASALAEWPGQEADGAADGATAPERAAGDASAAA